MPGAKRVLRVGAKILAWTLAGVLALVVLALGTVFIGVRTDAGARFIVRTGLGLADRYLAAKITVGRLHTDLLHGLELDDVEMRDIEGELAAHIDQLKVSFSLVPLLHNTLHITSVDIIGARGRARSLRNGKVNFADLLRPSTPQPPAPSSPASKFRVQIDNVHAEVDGLYEPPPGLPIPKLEGHIIVAGGVGIGGGDVRVKVDSLSVHLVGPAPADVHAEGGLHVKGVTVTFDPTKVTADFTAAMARAYFKEPKLRGKYHLDGEGHGPLAALDLQAVLTTPSQPVRVEGQLRIATPFGWTGHVLTRDLDPEAVLVDVPHARVWIDAKGESKGPDITVAIAHAQVETKRNRAHASGKLDLDQGLHAALSVDLDLRQLAELRGPGIPPLAGSLVGHARVSYDPRSLRVDTKLDGKNLVLPGVRIRELTVQGQTVNLSGHLAVRTSEVVARALKISSARLQFDGTTRQFLLRASVAGDSDTSLELGLTGTPRYETGPMPVGIGAVVTALDANRNGEHWHVDPGAKISYDHGLRVDGLRARSQRQSLTVDGRFQPETKRIDAEVRAVGLDLRRVVALVARADRVPASQLDLSLSAHGTIDRPKADLSLAGTITRSPSNPDEQVHLKLDAHVDPTQVKASLSSETGAGSVTLALHAPYVTSVKALLRSTTPLSVKLDTKLGSLAKLYSTIGFKPRPVLAALDGTFGLSVDLEGSGHAPTLQLALSGDGVHYGTMQNAALRAKVLFANDALQSTTTFSLGTDAQQKPAGKVTVHANLPIAIATILGTGTLAQKLSGGTPLDAWLQVQGIALGSLPYAALGLKRAVDAGTLDGEAKLTGRIGAPVLHVDFAGKDIVRGAVSGIAFNGTVDSANRDTHVAAHALVQGSPLANAKGTLGFDLGMLLSGAKIQTAVIDADVDLPGFDLSKFAGLIPGLTGKLHGSVVAKGRLDDPSAVADLDIDGFKLGEATMDTFALHGSYREHQVKAELKVHEPSGGFLDGAFALAGQNVDATLRAQSFSVDFKSEGESIPIRMLRGVLDAQLSAKGPLDAPLVTGHLGYAKGALGLTADPREISELTLQLTVDPSQLKLQKLTGKLGGGKFEVTGGAKLDHLVPTSLDLVLHTKQLPAVENPISVAVDSQITIHGERKNGALAGTIRVDSGSARLPTLTNVRDLQSTSELRDVVYVDERGRAAAVKRSGASRGPPLQITIETKLPGPFHVRSKELDVDLRGDLSATVHGSDFRLRGVVESLIGGHLEMFGKRYDIDHVRVSFDGGKTINPFLDVKLTRQLIAALITVEVEGTAEKPQLHLSAQPGIYSDSQIIQAILGGDPGDATTDRGLDQKVTGAISGLIVGEIKDQLAPQLPIDVIKVDVGDSSAAGYTGIAQTRLEIGKYLSSSIYVSYVHQFGALQIGTQVLSANLGTFEYRFKRHYALDLTIGDAPEGRADLFWSIRY